MYSILFDSSNFFSYWLTLSTTCNHRFQGGDWLMDLFISADTIFGGTDLSLTHSMQEMVPETSYLLVTLLQPNRAGRCVSSCAPSLEEIPFLRDSLRWRVNGVISSPPHPYQTNVVAQQNTWQPSVSLETSLKGGKTEAGLNELQCFECWHVYNQPDWYLDYKLCFLCKRDYKQKIWSKSLLVWLYCFSK